MISKGILIFFVVFLVVSITPICAVQIASINEGNSTEINDLETSLINDTNDLESLGNEIKCHALRCEGSINYIKDNYWKFWKWDKVKDKLKQAWNEYRKINSLVENLSLKEKKIEKSTKKIEELENNYTTVNDSSGYGNANQIVKQLQNINNKSYSINNPTDFEKGDIIQYKNPENYYNYLEYVSYNNTTDYVILKNHENNIMMPKKIFNEIALLKISTNTPTTDTIKSIHEIQYNTYNKQQKKTSQQKNVVDIVSTILTGVIFLLSFLAAFGALIGVTISASTGGSLTSLGMALIIMAGLFGGMAMNLGSAFGFGALKDSYANKVFNNENWWASINKWPASYPMVSDLNVTGIRNVSINGSLNVTHFGNQTINFEAYSQPEHGTVTVNKNGSYIYTPNSNYTGNDSFKYQCKYAIGPIGSKIIYSNVAEVKITISAASTKFNVSKMQGTKGQYLNITGKLLDEQGKGIAGKNVIFMLNNTIIGNATTNNNGTAILRNYLLRNTGNFQIKLIFLGDFIYPPTNGTFPLTINPPRKK